MKFLLTIIFLIITQFLFAQQKPFFSQTPRPCDCINPDTIKLSCFNKYDISVESPIFFRQEIYKEISCNVLDSVATFLLGHPKYNAWVEVHIDTLSFNPIYDSSSNRFKYTKDQQAIVDQTRDNALGYSTALVKYLKMSGVKNILFNTGNTASIDSCKEKISCYHNYIIYCPNNNHFDNFKKDSLIILKNINFETGDCKLKSESFKELNELYRYLNNNSDINIEVSGHTDNVGDKASNQKLSENRAKSVADYLIKKGITSNRIIFKGFGNTKPIANNSTEEGREKNRRVEIKINKK